MEGKVTQRRSLRYIRLAAYFAGLTPDTDRVSLTLREIQAIVGQALPGNSRFPSWWRNDQHKMHSRAWLTAGWRVAEMDPDSGKVVFVRESPPEVVL